jgi:outer membrane lipoprotein-sorting protein
VVALVASGLLSADAKPNLAPQTAAQLLAAVGNAKLAGFSGTVVEKAALGLPELPNLTGSDSAAGFTGLLTGSHTVRVWYGGQTKQRMALLNSLGEQDVFRNGRSVWQWDSDARTADHTVLPSDAAGAAPSQVPNVTPDQAARQALSLIDPSTRVSTDRSALVAGRPAYVLVLTPKDSRSRVGSVRITVDGKTKVPLGVQVLARGSKRAVLDVSFTRFDDSMPSNDNFNWTPPPGATVDGTPPRHPAGYQPPAGLTQHPDVTPIGSGWSTVFKVSGVPTLSALGSQDKQAGALLAALPEVHGSWGSGRLFSSALLSGLFTSDGRVFVGAVDPELLYQAAAAK